MDKTRQQLANIESLEQQLGKILLSTDEEGNYLRGHEVLRVLMWEMIQHINQHHYASTLQIVIDGLRERRQQRIADETTEKRRERERDSERDALNQYSPAVGAARERDPIRYQFNPFEGELAQKLTKVLAGYTPAEATVALTSALFSYIFCRWGNWPMTVEGVIECLRDHAGSDRIPNFRRRTIQVPG